MANYSAQVAELVTLLLLDFLHLYLIGPYRWIHIRFGCKGKETYLLLLNFCFKFVPEAIAFSGAASAVVLCRVGPDQHAWHMFCWCWSWWGETWQRNPLTVARIPELPMFASREEATDNLVARFCNVAFLKNFSFLQQAPEFYIFKT